jgi:hypothetical protein
MTQRVRVRGRGVKHPSAAARVVLITRGQPEME